MEKLAELEVWLIDLCIAKRRRRRRKSRDLPKADILAVIKQAVAFQHRWWSLLKEGGNFIYLFFTFCSIILKKLLIAMSRYHVCKDLRGCEQVRLDQDSFVLAELRELSPEAVSVPGHLEANKRATPHQQQKLVSTNSQSCCCFFTSLSSLASLSLSSSMVMSSRG